MRRTPVQRFFAGLLASLLLPGLLLYAQDKDKGKNFQDEVKKYHISNEPRISHDELVKHLREKVKYVFVLYQENRSFDSYFGTFPGAEGLFSHPPGQTLGFTQYFLDIDEKTAIPIQPFRIGPFDTCPKSTVNGKLSPLTCYAADTEDVDHSHVRIVAKMDVQNGVAKMDQFAANEQAKAIGQGKTALTAKQMGELTMAYEDCDTIPLLWAYAKKFVLFDNVFQQMTGPSTPGNLAIIGAQSGETQWALHPAACSGVALLGDSCAVANVVSGPGVPVPNDLDPFWGSAKDPTTPATNKMPVTGVTTPTAATGTANPQINLTFATLPLTLAGKQLDKVVLKDEDPDDDLADVQEDVSFISFLGKKRVTFGWYQEGFDKEPTDPGPVDASGTHASYSTHHNGPQYFGYISNNSEMRSQLHGLEDFFIAVSGGTLPKEGGVFFVKGGFQNLFGLTPADPDSKVQTNFPGDDDHPGYSDAQISEAMVAKAINAIAASPYWSQSAIIINWDDSEGDYDHVPPPIRTFGPDGSQFTNGPRVPLLLISPFARTDHVAHAQGSQSSVVKFVDLVFDLPPLATLPDELRGREIGEKMGFNGLGPEDALTPGITDLVGAFSPSRLTGKADPLPASYVKFPDSLITNLPFTTKDSSQGCSDLGITTADRQQKIQNNIPGDFNPRPETNPN